MALSVLCAVQRDRKALLRLLAAQLDEHGIDLGFKALTEAVDGCLAEPERGFFLIARVGRKAVGAAYLSLVWTLEHGGPSAWLEELFVLPSHRGHGIGTAILREAVIQASGRGCRAIDLEVEHSHRRAEALYEREGFGRHTRQRWVKRLTG
jgi:GNAT superfamily N-acetyltransferase